MKSHTQKINTMKIKFTLLYSIALSMAIAFGCGSESASDKKKHDEQIAQKTQDSIKVVKEKAEAMRVKDEAEMLSYEANYDRQIESNNQQIKEVKERLKASDKARDKATLKTIDSLDMRNENLKLKLKSYKTDHSDWAAFKREFDHDMGEIGKALKDLTVNNKK
jgi:flagellar motor protein MotB